ncbi:hypothetical protein [Pseudanabaena sp. BC1403]|uniref:hypothetical protein n=1 Tax=Pseudanabaena sp. BC1403 TaxID=2043171 RepID=UPI0015E1A2A6|nr:hypothetical protein [Pseudanabaena sp. BC1403]
MRTEIFCEEFKNCVANALPLQIIGVDGNRNFDHPIKNHRKALPPPFTHTIAIAKR